MQWGLGQYSSKVHPVNKQMDWLVIENNFLLLTKFFFFSLKNTTADCFDLHSDQANRTNHHQNKKSTLLDNIFMIYTVSSDQLAVKTETGVQLVPMHFLSAQIL